MRRSYYFNNLSKSPLWAEAAFATQLEAPLAPGGSSLCGKCSGCPRWDFSFGSYLTEQRMMENAVS